MQSEVAAPSAETSTQAAPRHCPRGFLIEKEPDASSDDCVVRARRTGGVDE